MLEGCGTQAEVMDRWKVNPDDPVNNTCGKVFLDRHLLLGALLDLSEKIRDSLLVRRDSLTLELAKELGY